MPDAHAVIDIGSGSASVAVFRREGAWLKRTYQEGLPLRLMRKIDATGALSGPAVRATVTAVCAFMDHVQGRGARSVEIVNLGLLLEKKRASSLPKWCCEHSPSATVLRLIWAAVRCNWSAFKKVK